MGDIKSKIKVLFALLVLTGSANAQGVTATTLLGYIGKSVDYVCADVVSRGWQFLKSPTSTSTDDYGHSDAPLIYGIDCVKEGSNTDCKSTLSILGYKGSVVGVKWIYDTSQQKVVMAYCKSHMTLLKTKRDNTMEDFYFSGVNKATVRVSSCVICVEPAASLHILSKGWTMD